MAKLKEPSHRIIGFYLGFFLHLNSSLRKLVASVLLAGLMCSAAFAEGNWVERFLARYKAPQVSTKPRGTISITTQDTIRLLLENNRDVSVNRLAPVSSLYEAQALTRLFEPVFYAIANMDRANTPSQTLLAGAPSLLQLTHNLRFGFEQVLTTGTIYNANVEFIRGSSNSTFNLFNPFFNGLITYSLTQHVLRDFGRAVNTAKIRIARNNEKMSELQFELQIVDLVTDTLELYWDLKFAEEDVKVKQRSLDLAKRTLRDSQIQVDVGTLAPIDLIQPEADVAERNEALLTAQYDVDLLQDRLKKLISNDLDPGAAIARLNLIESIREPDSQTLLSLDTAIQHALESRREMKLAGYDLENREIDVHYTKNQMLPVFNLTATYSQAGLGGSQTIRSAFDDPTIIRIIPGGIGDVFNQLFRFDHLGYATGFDLRIPIKNRAARAEYERALNERQISTQRKAATAQNIVLEVRNAYTQIQKNEARVTSTRITRELALRRLEAEQKKFELGTSTIRFVLEEQRNLAQAETDEIEALVNYTKALINYDRAIGNTLQRNNIEIQKQLPSQVLYQD